MIGVNEIAQSITHEYRAKILMEWLPNAQPDLNNKFMKLLWEAYFIYVEPNGIKKPDCKICVNNVYNNWLGMKNSLIAAEQQYNMLEAIQ